MNVPSLRERIAVALHDLHCPDRTCEPTVFADRFGDADAALAVLADWLRSCYAANNVPVIATVSMHQEQVHTRRVLQFLIELMNQEQS